MLICLAPWLVPLVSEWPFTQRIAAEPSNSETWSFCFVVGLVWVCFFTAACTCVLDWKHSCPLIKMTDGCMTAWSILCKQSDVSGRALARAVWHTSSPLQILCPGTQGEHGHEVKWDVKEAGGLDAIIDPGDTQNRDSLPSPWAVCRVPSPKPKFGLLLLRQFLLCVYKYVR